MRNGLRNSMRLVIVGAGSRLIAAGVVVLFLWLGFFWATASVAT